VRLYRKGELVAAGSIDGVMPDGSAIWHFKARSSVEHCS
jgi:hypothetical protein